MDVFSLTKIEILGIVFLLVGAVITFASAKISAKWEHKHANLITKIIGLALAIVGFILVFV